MGGGELTQEYYNRITAGMTKDQKVNLYQTGSSGSADVDKDRATDFIVWNKAVTGDSGRYFLQEELGESVENYIQRRDEARKRDELRKRMLGSTNVSGADGKDNSIKRENLG